MTRLYNEREVSKMLSLSLPTLRRWRAMGSGPKHLKLGESVRYREVDIVAYLDEAASLADKRRELAA
jgi:predicted DNA-binding transcriptional regulator AlpA